jgi:hypothetical protein
MYIPTWILILIIAGVFYYLYTKKKSDEVKSINSPKVENADNNTDTQNEDWLDSENWQDIALEHMAKFPKRTGKSRPTYEEMLELDENEFKAWLFVKGEGDNQEQTLKEMIEHESRTGSFTKTARADIPPHEQLILNVFDKDKSAETIKAIRNLDKVANELKDDKKDEDIVKQSIWAKATSDYFKLSEK